MSEPIEKIAHEAENVIRRNNFAVEAEYTNLEELVSKAKLNTEQCSALKKTILFALNKVRQTQDHSALYRGIGEFHEIIRSASSLVQTFSAREWLRRSLIYKAQATKFSAIVSRLFNCLEAMNLPLLQEESIWNYARRQDADTVQMLIEKAEQTGKDNDNFDENVNKYISKHLASYTRGCDDPDQEAELLKKDFKKLCSDIQKRRKAEKLYNVSRSVAPAAAVEPTWQLYVKEVTFDVDDDEDRIEIGRGSFGVVYRGTFRGLPVAIKYLRIKPHAPEVEQFKTEVHIMSRLVHPNVVTFYGACLVTNKGYMIMEQLECSLTDILYDTEIYVPEKRRKEVKEHKKHIALQIAQAMCYLHTSKPQQIVHRDMKPSNVMIDDNVHVKVVDFGLAVKQRVNASDGNQLAYAGTRPYMAPELYKKETAPSHKVDVYAFGVTVNELYVEMKPFRDVEDQHIGAQICDGTRPDMRKDMDEVMADIIKKSWDRDPEVRPEFAVIVSELIQEPDVAHNYVIVDGQHSPAASMEATQPSWVKTTKFLVWSALQSLRDFIAGNPSPSSDESASSETDGTVVGQRKLTTEDTIELTSSVVDEGLPVAPLSHDNLTRMLERLPDLAHNPDQISDVILSCVTTTDEEGHLRVGTLISHGIAHELKNAGMTPFSWTMMKTGQNWQETWFGEMATAKAAIVVVSESYFNDRTCRLELSKLCHSEHLRGNIFTVVVGDCDFSVDFMREKQEDNRADNDMAESGETYFARYMLHGNMVPTSQGLFQDNWNENMMELISKVQTATKFSAAALITRLRSEKDLEYSVLNRTNVIVSYRTNIDETSTDEPGHGRAICRGVAQELFKAGFYPFYRHMTQQGTQGGTERESAWQAEMPLAKVAIVLLSKTFFASEDSKKELVRLCREPSLQDAVFPLVVGDFDINSDFMGDSIQEKKTAYFIRTMVKGKLLPESIQGTFQDHWSGNMKILIGRIARVVRSEKHKVYLQEGLRSATSPSTH